jgi:hypothetical protein
VMDEEEVKRVLKAELQSVLHIQFEK